MARIFKVLRTVVFILAILSYPLTSHGASSLVNKSPEEVKSAFIFNFIKFIEWPDEKMDIPDSKFCVGVIGRDPISKTLKSYEDLIAKDKVIEIKQYKNLADIGSCHVLYISPDLKNRATEIINHIKGKNILTISHYDGFDLDGGILDFVIKDNKFRFIINYEAAKSEKLKISSKLLNLAIISRKNN